MKMLRVAIAAQSISDDDHPQSLSRCQPQKLKEKLLLGLVLVGHAHDSASKAALPRIRLRRVHLKPKMMAKSVVGMAE